MNWKVLAAVAAVCISMVSTQAEVVIETVTVGNPGNSGELSGGGAPGGFGPDRICGAVGYVYKIGMYEVTVGQYTEFLNAVAGANTYGLYDVHMGAGYTTYPIRIQRTGSSPDYSYSVVDDWADRPMNFIDWGDAARFANWLHNGQPMGVQDASTTEHGSYDLSATHGLYLVNPDGTYPGHLEINAALMEVIRSSDATWVIPSEDEWYKSAYHKNDGVTGHYFDYPTSSNVVPSNAAVDPDPGNNATFTPVGYEPTIGAPTEVGAHENSASPYGTFDQGGNVREWHEAKFDHSLYPGIYIYRGVRGGSSSSYEYYLYAPIRIEGNYQYAPTNTGPGFGFRVASTCRIDIECDGDVDLDDFALFVDEVNDLRDFALFQRRFTGPR